MKPLNFWFSLAVLCAVVGVFAQQDGIRTASIHLLIRSYGDSVVLRWAPTKPGAWRLANAYGYRVWRQELPADTTQPLSSPQLMTASPLKPWTLAQWKERFRHNPNRRTAAVAVQMLYGKPSVSRQKRGWMEALRLAALELQNRYSFALLMADLDPMVATGLALRWVDRKVERQKQYVYTVEALVPDSVYVVHPATAVVTVTAPPPIAPPSALSAEEGDGQILLQWQNTGAFTAFYVDRMEEGKGAYQRLTKVPLVKSGTDGDPLGTWIYRDTAVRNYVQYRYRVIGITPFGEQSPPATVTAMGRDRTPPAMPSITKALAITNGWVRLQWQWNDTISKDMQGFVIYRSADGKSGYKPLMTQPLSPTVREFVDTTAEPAEPFYLVAAVDTARNAAFSLPYRAVFIDTIPPAPPAAVFGRIDSQGIVRLWWRWGQEPDLLGYRVLWANDTTHEFSQATNTILSDTVFVDTVALNTLTPFVYYRVVAVDFRRNHSAPSPVLRLRRPDTIPPVPPVLQRVVATNTAIQLKWIPSSSQDVVYQEVQRRTGKRMSWQTLVTLAPQDSLFLDQTAAPDTLYVYRIVAVDASGNHTSSLLSAETALPRIYGADPVVALQVQYDTEQQVVRLRWEYPYQPNQPFWFVIYRGYQARPLEPYKAVPATERTFVDRDFIGKGVYRYAVQVRRQMFGVSPLSPAVMIEVPRQP